MRAASRWQYQGDLGYGEDIGDTTALPPYRQFFAGGPDSVRGYRESRLGPKDNFGNPYGGNMQGRRRAARLLFPMPEKWRTTARVSLFYDIGNVFSTGHVGFCRARTASRRSITSSSMIS